MPPHVRDVLDDMPADFPMSSSLFNLRSALLLSAFLLLAILFAIFPKGYVGPGTVPIVLYTRARPYARPRAEDVIWHARGTLAGPHAEGLMDAVMSTQGIFTFILALDTAPTTPDRQIVGWLRSTNGKLAIVGPLDRRSPADSPYPLASYRREMSVDVDLRSFTSVLTSFEPLGVVLASPSLPLVLEGVLRELPLTP